MLRLFGLVFAMTSGFGSYTTDRVGTLNAREVETVELSVERQMT